MSIEINGLGNPLAGVVSESGQSQQKPQKDAAQSNTQSGGDDVVNLTDSARKLSRLEEEVRNQPVVDSKRVDAVRHAIDSGAYEVRPDQIANKVAQFEAVLPA